MPTSHLIATRLNPLAEDDPGALLLFYGPMFFIWGVAGFGAYRRSGLIFDAVKAGGFVAFVNYDYLKATPFKLLVATLIGCVTGLIGGLIGKMIVRLGRGNFANMPQV